MAIFKRKTGEVEPRKPADVATRYNEYEATAAAVILSTSYGDPNTEQILPTFQSYVLNGYQANSVVFSVILARLMLFSEAQFTFQSIQDGKLFGTPDLALLENPWPNGTTGELLARMEQDVSLAGNAYIRNVDGQRLERLRPDRVTIVSELLTDSYGRQYRQVVGYAYDRTGTGDHNELYDVSEVAHWSPIPDPLADFRGMSWLTAVLREIAADQGLTDYKIQYMMHAATPNMVVKYAGQLKPADRNALEDRLAAKYSGVGNAFKTLILDSGADYSIVGNSFEQMQFTDVQGAGETRIAAAAGVPPIVVGLKEGLQAATYSNYALAMRRFADLTMRPLWRSACAALAPLVNVPLGSRLWFDTRNIAALQAGEAEAAAMMKDAAAMIQVLVASGFDPDTAVAAAMSRDFSVLKHTGVIPFNAPTNNGIGDQNNSDLGTVPNVPEAT